MPKVPAPIIIPRSPFAQMPLRGLSPLCLPESQACSQQLSVASICPDVTSHAHHAEAHAPSHAHHTEAHAHDAHEGVGGGRSLWTGIIICITAEV